MADVKISGLPASTVPLAGTEVLPIVQGSQTRQVSIANVTAGRAIAATSITTDTYKAASSSGGALQNSGGTPQLQWGASGGNNLSLEVATNINPANAPVAISPTGTGTVAISPAGALTVNPTAASTMNNVAIGGTTPLAGKFTTLESSGDTVLGTNAVKVFASGGVSVGNTTDPGTTNLSVTGNVTAANLVGSTYTPTLTGVTNFTSGTPFSTGYMRVGNYVQVSGAVNITAGAIGYVVFRMSLPVASNLTGNSDGGGVSSSTADSITGTGYIGPAAATDDMQFVYSTSYAPEHTIFFTFGYKIL